MKLIVKNKEFYLGSRAQAHYRLRADEEGTDTGSAVLWDFALSTEVLDGDIPAPGAIREDLARVITDSDQHNLQAFLALFFLGKLDTGEIDSMTGELALALLDNWHKACTNYLLSVENERLRDAVADLAPDAGESDDDDDDDDAEEEHLRELECICAYAVKNDNHDRWGLILTQFPRSEDGLKEVWELDEEVGVWQPATVRGSHTIPTALGVNGAGQAWQGLLHALARWALERDYRPSQVHMECDGEVLLADEPDPRHTYDADILEEDEL